MHEINQYLDSAMMQKSRQWQRLKDALVLALPPEVLKKVVYASLEDTTLTIFSDSPAWTGKLRFYDGDIKKVFTAQGMVVRVVQSRSVPPVTLRS